MTMHTAHDAVPEWYRQAMSTPPEAMRIEVDGARLDCAVWGELGKPGVLLLVGNGAHIGWWRPIAPLLAQDYRVAAFNWSGMGSSDWRDSYSSENFIAEAMAVAEVSGLFDAAVRPILAAHSFGGFQGVTIIEQHGERFRGAMLIDSRLRIRSAWGAEAPAGQFFQLHQTREAAIARFRLKPEQPSTNPFIIRALAEESLEEVDGGWRWRADPEFRSKTELGPDLIPLLPTLRCPMMFVRGQLSTSVTADIWEEQRAAAPDGTPFVEIPDAHHHLMIDQPLALLSVMRALFAALPKRGSWLR
jgi:pimeloyl-ACP methyl ester carboxylesterase